MSVLDSVTIFTKTGVILYHYQFQDEHPWTNVYHHNSGSPPTSSSHPAATVDTEDPHHVSSTSIQYINEFISTVLLDPTHEMTASSLKSSSIQRTILSVSSSPAGGPDGVSTVIPNQSTPNILPAKRIMVEWLDGSSLTKITSTPATIRPLKNNDFIAMAVYPPILVSSASTSSYLKTASTSSSSSKSFTNVSPSIDWICSFLKILLHEYIPFYHSTVTSFDTTVTTTTTTVPKDKSHAIIMMTPIYFPPNPHLFDTTFHVIYNQTQRFKRMEKEETTDPTIKTSTRNACTNPSSSSNTVSSYKMNKGKKEGTVWHDGLQKVTKESMAALDQSKDSNPNLCSMDAVIAENSRALMEARAVYLPSEGEVPLWEEEDDLVDDATQESGLSTTTTGNGWGMSLKGLFDQISGNKVLTSSDLDAPFEEMQRLLTSKNVSSEIALTVCNNVKTKLIGKRMTSFARVKTTVRMALEDSIERILKPSHHRDIDLLQAVITKREQQRSSIFGMKKANNMQPYVVVMVGINGVGKSTSLAKIAYYLKSNQCCPLIAACDTFRSGAVEQLNVHAKCLDVPLYQMGYSKDPSAVAKAAINHAAQNNHDVVLVDTAGRMQNNVPLMLALSKLIVENKPDLVLFVCEALVGNDGMDQLNMFNKALKSAGHSRQIDGIVLTKFDTVSDKVGAALTMTHITGAPVVFVGTGQKYNHLKKLSVQSVIKSLFA